MCASSIQPHDLVRKMIGTSLRGADHSGINQKELANSRPFGPPGNWRITPDILFPDFLQIGRRRTVDHLAFGGELRTMAWAVPTALESVPGHHASNVRA